MPFKRVRMTITMINTNHDGKIRIATGKNRHETSWRNKELTWADLLKKLSVTHHTAETYAEYMSSKRQRQDELKDVGGFVGGYLTGGRRKSGSVLTRQLVTLDVDFGTLSAWEDFIMIYNCAACIYSTHKHSNDTPRYRFVVPLDREVMSDEYIAISRRIAGILDIEAFDPTTFQPERLMYWPSTSKDAQYLFEYQDGPWLSADAILNTYYDWRDSSEWPVSERTHAAIARGIKKQGDPTEKGGIIGAFCRTYTISEAIDKYLQDVYEPCDVEGRYTYKQGSTSAGVVVYEEKYAYSHHGTDPTSSKLCNAFDLVRLHKFGLKDEDARADTPINKLPSFIAMEIFAAKDPLVRSLLGSERLEAAQSDFSGLEGIEAQDIRAELAAQDTKWLEQMDVDKKGNNLNTINNMVQVLNNDPLLKDRFKLDTFEQRELAVKDLPWRKVTEETRFLTDSDDAGLRYYLEKMYNLSGTQRVRDAFDVVLLNKAFHPIREYLQGLEWDGVERVERMLIDYMGCEDSTYIRAVTRKTLAAAVARVFKPGIKFDYALVLVGEEGIKKSTLINVLGGAWFTDSFTTIQGKEAYEQLQGVWLVEMAELAGLKKADVDATKHFISKRVDRFRVAFGRRVADFPRQCIFFATTNKRDFLRIDAHGNRKFWAAMTNKDRIVKDPFKMSEAERSQIWAEAVSLFRGREPLFLDSKLEAEARKIQREHSEEDERVGLIRDYLEKLLPVNWESLDIMERRGYLQGNEEADIMGAKERDRVCVAELWCEVLGGMQKDMTRYNTKAIHDIMRTMDGWEDRTDTKMRFGIYGLQRGYVRSLKSVTREPDKCYQ